MNYIPFSTIFLLASVTQRAHVIQGNPAETGETEREIIFNTFYE